MARRKITLGWRITGTDENGIRRQLGLHFVILQPCLESKETGVLFKTRAYAEKIRDAMNERLLYNLKDTIDFRIHRVVRWV